MKIYAQADEEKIRAQASVREWRHSGLLDAAQGEQFESELRVHLRRTNFFFRAVLFLFTFGAVTAAVFLAVTVFHIQRNSTTAIVCFACGTLCIGLAEFLIRNFHFYRHGAEEAFSIAGAILLSVAAGLVSPSSLSLVWVGDVHAVVAAGAGAVAFLGLYLRFGYVYAAMASVICAAATPLVLDLPGETDRLLAALVCALIFLVIRQKRVECGDDFPGDDYAVIQALSWACLYLTLNLHIGIGGRYEQGVIYWSTYAMTWLLPVTGLWLALRTKDRLLMDVSIVMALLSVSTNKPYLHWERRPWDPIVFGLLLIGSALLIKRWLVRGTIDQHRGFTGARLLARDGRAVTVLSVTSAALQPGIMPGSSTTTTAKPTPGGGRSGGAGASGSF